jgi:asparagine synthase (glutamine-hydrolysing)
MFAAIVDLDRRPIDPAELGIPAATSSRELCRPGGARHVVLLRDVDPSPMREIETSAIEELGQRFWLVGRLRLDGRGDLLARLDLPAGGDEVSDAGLCLRAYAKWGDRFLDHVFGDYAFVLWDAARETLIAARDQLGVRSLYHARSGSTWIGGDSLEWILSRPGIGRDLDDYWIADHLTAGASLDFDRTAWRAVQRLAPAHLLSVSTGVVEARRYWRLELGEPLYLRDRGLYAEIFRERVRQAVADRLPPQGRIGLSMGGGLDSTMLAAMAVETSGDRGRVVAACYHFERLIPDDELGFARLAAGHLGIELDEIAFDDTMYDPEWRNTAACTPEPWAGALRARYDRAMGERFVGHAGVWLQGEGPDNALRLDRAPYLSWLRGQRRWGRLAEALWLYVRAKGLRHWDRTLRRYAGGGAADAEDPGLPPWIEPGLAARLHLGERLAAMNGEFTHPWHPSAMASFGSTLWQRMFADIDIEESLAPVVWRHPFLDLRVLQFMLSLPPVPWAYRKLVMREAMRSRLPTAILTRDKTALSADPMPVVMRGRTLPPLQSTEALARWIDLPRLRAEGTDSAWLENLLRVHTLDHWFATHTV